MSSSFSTFAPPSSSPSKRHNDQQTQPTVARTLEQELFLQNHNQIALDKVIQTTMETMDYPSTENDILSSTTANLNELSKASLDYFSNYTASPAKMSQLQGLITSLHTLLSDQSYAMGDLRTQLDEIQEVLNRVQPKQDTMTSQERQIVHNAQMMKNLAEEVIAAKVEKRDSGFQDSLTAKSPLMVSLAALRSLNAPDTPPPTARTPPRPSSTTPSLSSTNTDRQYTLDDDRSSRPSSVSSSYRRQQKKKRQSVRQLESLEGQGQYEEESKAAFDRICSLLTHLITDASTAVGTATDGTLPNIPLPQMSPLESDFDQSSSGSEEDDEGQENLGEEEEEINDMAIAEHEEQLEDEEMDDHHRLYLSESPSHSFEDENQSEDDQLGFNSLRKYRTGSRSSIRPDRSANRLSSLFMELQNTQSNDPTLEDPDKSSGVIGSLGDELSTEFERKPRKSSSSTSLSSSRGKIRRLSVITKKPSMEISSPPEPLETESPIVQRHRSSFSSLRSPRLQLPRTDELQENHQVEVELDRTVETIDGLTRELVAVATHQNWMQMKLQRTLQFQKQQVEHIESSLSSSSTTSSNLRSLRLSSTEEQDSSHPLEDLSRSLKQVAVSVGKVIASTTTPNRSLSSSVPSEQGTLRTRLPQQKGNLSRVDSRTVTKPRFSGKEFAKYFQELEKIAALGSKLGFGKGDGSHENEDTEDTQRQEAFEDPQQDQELFSHGSTAFTAATSPSSPTSIGPPDLEDFAAQCRLLTRALVLPFVQLTHHAMTSQDSVLALSSTPTRSMDQSSEWEALNMEESFDQRSIHSRDTSYHSATEEAFSPRMSPGTYQSSTTRRSSTTPPSWPSSPLFSGRDLDSILRNHSGELSPDSIVKAKTIVSTGLYLIHLLYWTVLFVIGSLVLDSWLAETAGQQVIRIVDQVRDALAAAGIGAPRIEGQEAKILGTIEEPPFFARSDEHLYERHQDSGVLEMECVSLDSCWDSEQIDLLASLTPISEQDHSEPLSAARVQALEDRAIEVAVGFETLKQRLSGPSSPISTSRPGSGLWGRQDSFQSTSSAFSSTPSATGTNSPEPDKMSGGGLMRGGSWVGPRRRRLTHTKDSKTRRFSSASRTPTMPVVVPRSVESLAGNGRRPRPMSHWGSFGPTFDFGASPPNAPSSGSPLCSTASSSTTLSEWTTVGASGNAKDAGVIATVTATMPATINVVTVASNNSTPRSRRNSM
ncbi:hypothetical protein BG003_011812 [Podila horticola]|nr:hypothetical protein BG003_011812 [Podila horticola]